MSIPLYPDAYKDLVDEDIEWLLANTKRSLERDHILAILNKSVNDYRDFGYEKSMWESDA